MRVVVLAEHQVHEAIVVVHHGQGVQLVVPDDVVGNLEAGVGRSHDHLLARGHEVGHLRVHGHTGQTVVTIGDHAHQLAVRRTVGGDGHGGVTVLLLEGYHVGQRHLGREVRVAGDEAGLVVLDASDHSGLVLDGLGAVHERQAAFGSKRDGHAVVGHGLHDGGHHGDVQRDGGLFAALELHERRLQADFGGNALGRRIAGNEQVLVKGSGRLVEIVCHELLHLRSVRCRGAARRISLRRASVTQVLPAIIATQTPLTRAIPKEYGEKYAVRCSSRRGRASCAFTQSVPLPMRRFARTA